MNAIQFKKMLFNKGESNKVKRFVQLRSLQKMISQTLPLVLTTIESEGRRQETESGRERSSRVRCEGVLSKLDKTLEKHKTRNNKQHALDEGSHPVP